AALVQLVADRAHQVFAHVYPSPYDPKRSERSVGRTPRVTSTQEVEVAGASGVVMAFGAVELARLAEELDVVLELIPQGGDFVSRGDPLFRVAGSGQAPPAALRGCIAIGPERTLEQDPRFVFRILVDIASKALSPAINDPTTAVQSLDQIQHLLQFIGRRHLDDGRVRDPAGELRLVYGTPNWADFVMLAVSE